MTGSSCVPPIVCGVLVLFAHESPRWLISQQPTKKAFETLQELRPSEIGGAKDFHTFYESPEYEKELNKNYGFNGELVDLLRVGRDIFAVSVSFLAIFGEQYDGADILVLSTTTIPTDGGIDSVNTIVGSIGVGDWLLS